MSENKIMQSMNASVANTKSAKKFRLLRYFAITSLLGVLVIIGPLVYFYRAYSIESLKKHVTENNVNITNILTNTIWLKYSKFFDKISKDRKISDENYHDFLSIKEDLLKQTRGLSVVKAKIYDNNGVTVFSTETSEVGNKNINNKGLLVSTLKNEPVSEIILKDKHNNYFRKSKESNIISSYVPIVVSGSDSRNGVFEVYSDVTGYTDEVSDSTLRIVLVVLGSMGFLYLFMFAMVKRADVALKLQESEVEQAHEAILTHQALHDHLTGLANRLNLTKSLDSLLFSMDVDSQKCAVFCLGIDGLKSINESLGHQSGDAAITEVSRRLQAIFGETQIISRLGGDEFAVVLCDLKSDVEFEQIIEQIERMQKAISSEPILFNGHEISISTSVGVSIYPEDGRSVEDILQSAERALAHTKKAGRGGYQFHSSGMNARAMDMLLLERELRKALIDDQFVLFYQPKVDINSGKIVGAEALIRWQHPTRGLIGPGAFIEVIEERGLVIHLGEWVLREACRQNAAWQASGMAHMPIAINLSAAHFNKTALASDVQKTLNEFSLESNCLELELTESSFMKDTKSSVSIMNEIRALGVYLALDDFGTGYSSLSQLKGLPLHNLKLDQSFVRGLPDDRDDLAICTAVIAMGNALGLKVIAEGVETLDQLNLLRSLGTDVAQGYYIAKPLPADRFLDFALKNVAEHSPKEEVESDAMPLKLASFSSM